MNEQPSSQDDVRRGLGMLPQRAIFEKASEGDFAKMSKPVQVCTACQFVKRQNIGQNYFRLGNNYAVPPVANSSTSRNPLFALWNLCPTWVQVIFEISISRLVPNLGTSEIPNTSPLAKLARSYLMQSLHEDRNDNCHN